MVTPKMFKLIAGSVTYKEEFVYSGLVIVITVSLPPYTANTPTTISVCVSQLSHFIHWLQSSQVTPG